MLHKNHQSIFSKGLSRRERQIMDVVYAKGQASVAQVHAALPDAPGYSSVRKTLQILEEKGRFAIFKKTGIISTFRFSRLAMQLELQ